MKKGYVLFCLILICSSFVFAEDKYVKPDKDRTNVNIIVPFSKPMVTGSGNLIGYYRYTFPAGISIKRYASTVKFKAFNPNIFFSHWIGSTFLGVGTDYYFNDHVYFSCGLVTWRAGIFALIAPDLVPVLHYPFIPFINFGINI